MGSGERSGQNFRRKNQAYLYKNIEGYRTNSDREYFGAFLTPMVVDRRWNRAYRELCAITDLALVSHALIRRSLRSRPGMLATWQINSLEKA